MILEKGNFLFYCDSNFFLNKKQKKQYESRLSELDAKLKELTQKNQGLENEINNLKT